MAEEPEVSQEAQGSYIAQATGGGTATIQVYASPLPQLDQNRQRFLVRLRTRYRDLLEQSLHGAVRMTLELAEYPEAVVPPVQLLYQSDQQPAHPLPAGTSLMQVYTDAGHELLLLGEPGAGKSTLVLELAFDLAKRAEQNHSQLLPVIVPLSSWASQRQPVEQWLAEQVALLYDISLPLSARWAREERLLPLLDGLDEMDEEARAACIAAINAYHHEHLHPLVVASRKAEYEATAANARLVLHSAVVVQSLTREQVDVYLVQHGEAVAALRTALRENPVLQEIVTTPLMLSILLLTYQGKAVNDLPTIDSLPEQQRQIFAKYVERMIERKKKLARSTPQDLVCWLHWLAQQMRKHNQTIFYLEHLQPDWLPACQQRAYIWLAVWLPGILIGGLACCSVVPFFGIVTHTSLLQGVVIGGFLGFLISEATANKVSSQPLLHGFSSKVKLLSVRQVVISIIIGLCYGLSFGLYLAPRSEYRLEDWLHDIDFFGVLIGLSCLTLICLLPSMVSHQNQPAFKKAPRNWQFPLHFIHTLHGRRMLLVTGVFWTGMGLSNLLSTTLQYGINTALSGGLNIILSDSLETAMGYGLTCLLISLILEAQARSIQLFERLSWSWRSLLKPTHNVTTLFLTCIVALMVGLTNGLSDGLNYGLSIGLRNGLSYGLDIGLSVGLSYWLLLGLFQSITSERIEDQDRRVPNQGIKRSARNSLLIGAISGVLIWLSIGLGIGLNFGLGIGLNFGLSDELNQWLSFWLSFDLNGGVIGGLIVGVSGGLLACTVSGGLAVLRHYIIRLLLARSHMFPWYAPRFLEEASARILLRRVGGGYSFPHRLLLDYFADLPQEVP